MKIGLGQLWSLLQDNVVEVKFTRRTPKPGDAPHRRMLCTNSQILLNSNDGKLTLHFTPPKHYPQYNPQTKNLIITWDIMMQSFRTINVDECDLISVIPGNEIFWDYFRDNLSAMRQTDKINFMNQ